MSRWLVGMVMAFILFSSDAWPQQSVQGSVQGSLQGLERSSQFEQAMRAVDAIKHRKRLQCVLSIANAAVCACLAQKLPVDTYVRSYGAIVSRDNDGPDYGRLPAAEKAVVDRCVADGR
jgi:hypothetical protein